MRGKVRFCATHDRALRREHDRERGTAASRGYDSRWRRARAAYLRAHPLCQGQAQAHPNEVRAATVVDHVVPHRGDDERFWDESNWQALCSECHNRKTAREDGRWG